MARRPAPCDRTRRASRVRSSRSRTTRPCRRPSRCTPARCRAGAGWCPTFRSPSLPRAGSGNGRACRRAARARAGGPETTRARPGWRGDGGSTAGSAGGFARIFTRCAVAMTGCSAPIRALKQWVTKVCRKRSFANDEASHVDAGTVARSSASPKRPPEPPAANASATASLVRSPWIRRVGVESMRSGMKTSACGSARPPSPVCE